MSYYHKIFSPMMVVSMAVLAPISSTFANDELEFGDDLIRSVPTGPVKTGKGGKGDVPPYVGPGQVPVLPGQNPGQVPGQVPVYAGQNPGQFQTPNQYQSQVDPGFPQIVPREPEVTGPAAPRHDWHDHMGWNTYDPGYGYDYGYDYGYNYGYDHGSSSWWNPGWSSSRWNRPGVVFQWNWNWGNDRYDYQREYLRQIRKRADRVRDRLKRVANAYPRNSYGRQYYRAVADQGRQLYNAARRGDYSAAYQLNSWVQSWESYLGTGTSYAYGW